MPSVSEKLIGGAQGKQADLLTLIIKSRMTRVLPLHRRGPCTGQGGEDGRINLGCIRLGIDRTDTDTHQED